MSPHDNIFLTDVSETYSFSSAPSRGSSLNIPQRHNRRAHSDLLLAQYQEARERFNSYTPEQVAAISYNTGTYVEFSGADNCDLITKSLENIQQGIKLLNIRDEVIPGNIQDGSDAKIVTKATVFIPTGKEEFFIKKISDFATEVTSTGKPKNNDLVCSIESITDAIKISSFWVGRPSDMPTDEAQWFEIWIDINEEHFDEIKNNAFNIINSLNIRHISADQYIRFPERLVVPVFANRTNLLDLIKQGVVIAEIRKPADPNAYFADSALIEQTEWADDLLNRTNYYDSGVAVCILDTGINSHHRLISPYVSASPATVNAAWGTEDKEGHGTNMAGIVLYNNLRRYLISNESFSLNHSIQSVKILEPNSPNDKNLYGAIVEQATLLADISSPTTKRIYCMAITDSGSSTNDGQPSSWSAAVDKISFEGTKKLFVISAGNVENSMMVENGYPAACLKKSVEDPAQSWNAITVGAYSTDVAFQPDEYTRGYSAVANVGELSPYSSTSDTWKSQWPIKPDVVCDGGNVATDGTNYAEGNDELSKLTLSKDINRRLFETIWATSAATAQCSNIAAELLAAYPSMTPETVRALIIHSARWTDAMKNQFGIPDGKTTGRRKLLRTCGYGVPNLDRAKYTYDNVINMIIEDEIQPYEKSRGSSPKMKEMKLYSLPWPENVLQTLENTKVNVRVTLSYFIEPGPGQKGWKNKYRYASSGLRFDIKRPNETLEQFQKRINNLMREDDYQRSGTTENNWYLGQNNRDVGSIHSDVWNDTAINLAQSGFIAVYPVVGWWRERTTMKKYNSKLRYSLIVTLETPEVQVDLYTPVMTKIASRVTVPVTTPITE